MTIRKEGAQRGRPPGLLASAREYQLTLHLSLDELTKLTDAAKAVGVPLATWIREVALEGAAWHR